MIKIVSTEMEFERLLCIFNGINKDWENKSITSEFRYFKEMYPCGEIIDGYMDDLLFGNHFQNFVLFAAIIETEKVKFWLTISDDEESPKALIQFYLKDENDECDNPQIDQQIDLFDVRQKLWTIYDFFNHDITGSIEEIEVELKQKLGF